LKTAPDIPQGICVELDPPRNPDMRPIMAAARILRYNGVNHITVSDSPLASVRFDVMSIAGIIKYETGLQSVRL
jgi:5,10-methylenetetrahydrofolate reductase